MRVFPAGLLLVLGIACSDTSTAPTPDRPAFVGTTLTENQTVLVDFEGSGLNCGDAASTHFPPLTFATRISFNDNDCGAVAHGGSGYASLGVFSTLPRGFTVVAPVHAVTLYVAAWGDGFRVSAYDANGNVIDHADVTDHGGPPTDANSYSKLDLLGSENAIAEVRFEAPSGPVIPTAYLDDVTLTTETGATPTFTGFVQPVDNGGVLNIAKAGSSIPVKFSMGGDFGLGVLLTIPTASAIACPTGLGADAIEETSVSQSGLTYDAAADQYTYAWKTQSSWKGTCKQLHMPLSDGVDHTALFQFK